MLLCPGLLMTMVSSPSLAERILLGKTHKSILLRETFFCTFRGGGGGGLHKNVSQILAVIDFFQAEKLPEKPCQQGKILASSETSR